jgi:hypothetical protein
MTRRHWRILGGSQQIPDTDDPPLWYATNQLITNYWADVDDNGGSQAHEFYERAAVYTVGANRFEGADKIRAFIPGAGNSRGSPQIRELGRPPSLRRDTEVRMGILLIRVLVFPPFTRHDPMKIDIDKLSESELIELNHRIVARLRFLNQMRAHLEMLEFRIGDRIGFHRRRSRSDLREYWHLGHDSLDDHSPDPRDRSGRRMGRFGAAGNGMGADEQKSRLPRLAAIRRSGRVVPGEPGRAVLQLVVRRPVPSLGMANSVPSQHRHGRHWSMDPARDP